MVAYFSGFSLAYITGVLVVFKTDISIRSLLVSALFSFIRVICAWMVLVPHKRVDLYKKKWKDTEWDLELKRILVRMRQAPIKSCFIKGCGVGIIDFLLVSSSIYFAFNYIHKINSRYIEQIVFVLGAMVVFVIVSYIFHFLTKTLFKVK